MTGPLTLAMRLALLSLHAGGPAVLGPPPFARGGERLDLSRWTWRTAIGATLPEYTLGALVRRRLVHGDGSSRRLTASGQSLALALSTPQDRKSA